MSTPERRVEICVLGQWLELLDPLFVSDGAQVRRRTLDNNAEEDWEVIELNVDFLKVHVQLLAQKTCLEGDALRHVTEVFNAAVRCGLQESFQIGIGFYINFRTDTVAALPFFSTRLNTSQFSVRVRVTPLIEMGYGWKS